MLAPILIKTVISTWIDTPSLPLLILSPPLFSFAPYLGIWEGLWIEEAE